MIPERSRAARILDPVLVALVLGVTPLCVDSDRRERLRSRVLAATQRTTGDLRAEGIWPTGFRSSRMRR